jgi:hypothetical protein
LRSAPRHAPDRPDERHVGPPVRPRSSPPVRHTTAGVLGPLVAKQACVAYKRSSPLTSRTRAPPPRLTPPPAASKAPPQRPRSCSPPAPTPTHNLLPRPLKNSPRRPFACPGRELAGAGGTAAGTGHRRHTPPPALPPPKLQLKSSLETPQVALHPRPAGPGRRFAGIWPDCHRPVLEDHIARDQVILRD